MNRIMIRKIEELPMAAKQFLKETKGSTVFAFDGLMGSGKTTFIKAICNEIGVTDIVTSPTFSIINEYAVAGKEPVYHFDFYRIENTAEAIDTGIMDYFYSGRICFIEWPDIITDWLPEDYVRVSVFVNEDMSRTVTIG